MLVRCVTSNWSTITPDKRYEVIEEQLGLYKVEWSAGDGRTVVWSESNTIFTKCSVGFEATKENADILIKMAKLAEELK